MAYTQSNASSYNQLIQRGFDPATAASLSGITPTDASSYGAGSNSNLGSLIPGAGGNIDTSGFTNVAYPQNFSGYPSQQVQLAMNATEVQDFVNQNPGFFISEIEPGVFAPGLVVTSAPPTGTVPVVNPSTEPSPFSGDPAQRAGQTTLTTPQPTASPFAAFTQVQTVPTAQPGAGTSTFQDPAQRGDAARIQAETAAAASSPYNAFGQVQTVPQPLQTPGTEPSPFALDPAQRGARVAEAAAQNSPSSLDPAQRAAAAGIPTSSPAPVDQNDAETARLARLEDAAAPLIPAANPFSLDPAQQAGADTTIGRLLAQRQATLESQKKLSNNAGDWRVRISLAPGSTYLYNAPSKGERGILDPLYNTNGVIFPYTPQINVGYKAKYSSADLTHSNYTNYFYQSSAVDSVRITGTFTAQDTVEAQYLLAVIHFFRSATKMFYGQDAERGAPPPLLFIKGLGEYQFNNHPCVLTSFEYSLPADVDYIRAGSPNNNGTDLLKRRTLNNLPTNPISGAIIRLTQLFTGQGIQKGGLTTPPAPSSLITNSPTYVPTKIEISLGLLPIVTRKGVSQQFSLKQFANGDLVKKGFW
jgi:hypothetical protein